MGAPIMSEPQVGLQGQGQFESSRAWRVLLLSALRRTVGGTISGSSQTASQSRHRAWWVSRRSAKANSTFVSTTITNP
jgi:hypothetical protein